MEHEEIDSWFTPSYLEDDSNFASLVQILQQKDFPVEEYNEPEFSAGLFNTDQSVEQIIEGLYHVDEEGFSDAVEILIKLKVDPVEILLKESLLLELEEQWQYIAPALAKKGEKVLDALIVKLEQEASPYVRATAAEALGYIKSPKAVGSLLSALDTEDWWTQNAVTKALGLIGDQTAVEALIKIAEMNSLNLKAIWALGELQDTRAVEVLINIAEKGEQADFKVYPDQPTRTSFEMRDARNKIKSAVYAVEALGKIGEEGILQVLIWLQKRLEQKNLLRHIELREAVNKAVEKIDYRIRNEGL